ncbi:MAG: GNAT family N-acetyltransferase [Chloroflexi bacterium]|nr:GNAT family N-acetyltransferase [Chloroflexota bacterium]
MPDQLVPLTLELAAQLRPRFLPDRPGPLVGLHVLNTGVGAFLVDRWPDPRTVLVRAGFDYALIGDPDAITATQLRAHVQRGAIDTAPDFDPVARAAFPELVVWRRVIFQSPPGPFPDLPVVGARVRRLQPSDAGQIADLNRDLHWIANPWGGPAGLAASEHAWGAFAEGQLVAVACSFHIGDHFEDLGVVTEAAYRGRGLSTACAAALCHDIERRGRRPSWSTSLDNVASQRVARKLGFRVDRYDRLLLPAPWV